MFTVMFSTNAYRTYDLHNYVYFMNFKSLFSAIFDKVTKLALNTHFWWSGGKVLWGYPP